MIETAMVFALGFLAACLCALLVLPAVNARAARLARRRTEALLPLSATEIAAERDFLRAEFAVRQRRLERAVETASSKRHADMAALGTVTMEAAALARDVAARKAEIGEALRVRNHLEGELKTARADGSASLATLLALEEAQADLLDSLLAARRARDGGPVDAATVADPEAAHRETGLREALAASEAALARAVAERDAGFEQDNADLRRRITDVADSLTRRDRLPAVAAYPMTAQAR